MIFCRVGGWVGGGWVVGWWLSPVTKGGGRLGGRVGLFIKCGLQHTVETASVQNNSLPLCPQLTSFVVMMLN